MPRYRGFLANTRGGDHFGFALDGFNPVANVRFHGFVVIARQIDMDLLARRHVGFSANVSG